MSGLLKLLLFVAAAAGLVYATIWFVKHSATEAVTLRPTGGAATTPATARPSDDAVAYADDFAASLRVCDPPSQDEVKSGRMQPVEWSKAVADCAKRRSDALAEAQKARAALPHHTP